MLINNLINKIKAIHRGNYHQTTVSNNNKKLLVAFIILLMTIGQLAVSIYLPAMPQMTQSFHTNPVAIQLSLTLYLVGYGISQFFYGPLSDYYGRRIIILVGLSIFIIASILSVIVGNIYIFLCARILQGAGIGCGDTMGRAMLCDCFQEREFVKAACAIGLAATVTPLMAPIIGAYIQLWWGWRGNFLIILLYGMASFILAFCYLFETKPPQFRHATHLKQILNTYWYIFRHITFMRFFIPGLICFAGETIYSMMSPFLLQQQLGLTAVEFGWLAVFTILGLLVGTLIANLLVARVAYQKTVLIGMCVLSVASLAMLFPGLAGHFSIGSILFPMIVFTAGIGIIYPNTNMGALKPFTATAGTAGALQGGLQMVLGGIIASIVGAIPMRTQLPLALTLTVLSISGLFLYQVWFNQKASH